MESEAKPAIDVETFMAVDMRVGIVLEVRTFREARKPAWQLHVDFGPELGTRWTSAQVTRFRDGGRMPQPRGCGIRPPTTTLDRRF